MQTIYFYIETEEPYGCFSNYSAHAVYLKGIIWPTAEHYYQAQKFAGSEREEQVRRQKTPDEAKGLGNDENHPPRSGWHTQIKDEVMLEVVRAKFTQHPDLQEVLLATGDAVLAENSKKDYYWGIGEDGSGRNQLGKTLMRVRSELCKENR